MAHTFETWSILQYEASKAIFDFLLEVNTYLKSLSLDSRADEQAILAEVDKKFAEVAKRICRELENKRTDLFNYPSEEIYFFDIFEMRKDKRLHLVARTTNGAVQHHRSWSENDGHLGECLSRGRDFYVNYRDDPREDHNSQERPTDREYFGCRISALIRAADGRKYDAHGAICITSSKSLID